MDPVQSWLDAKEVRLMAESLMAPAPEVDKSALDAGYGKDFEGFAESAPDENQDGGELVACPDGRPHAQRQFVRPAFQGNDHSGAGASPGGDAPTSSNKQRDAAGSALANARRMAEGSGMLGTGDKASGGQPAAQPVEQVVKPGYDSPFKVAADQSESADDPLARQVDPPEETPAVDEWADDPDPQMPQPPSGVDTPPSPPFRPAIDAGEPAQRPSAGQQPVPPVERAVRAAAEPAVRGPFLSRLQQFSAIIRRDLDAQAMFLIDNEGQILLDEVENPKLIQVARTLANASYRASLQTAGVAAVGNLHVKIGASATLEVIPVESRYGLLVLGAIFPAPLGADRVRQVADVLARTVEPRG